MLQQAQIAGAFLFGDGAFAQIRFIQIGADQVGAAQAGAAQVGAPQAGAGQIGSGAGRRRKSWPNPAWRRPGWFLPSPRRPPPPAARRHRHRLPLPRRPRHDPRTRVIRATCRLRSSATRMRDSSPAGPWSRSPRINRPRLHARDDRVRSGRSRPITATPRNESGIFQICVGLLRTAPAIQEHRQSPE